MALYRSIAWVLGLGLIADPAFAAPTTVGVFVGSNRPGAGQEPLQFAVRDAERMRSVLAEIGGLDSEHTLFLEDPDAQDVRAAIQRQQAVVHTLEAAGEQTVFVFYYSGHARSDALTLGDSELELSDLRPRLEQVQSTVTLAVLDACQAGAISGIKGIGTSGEFSYNSAEMLRSRGLAVMASSTATELSQESEELGGSFFTHHLVTGLRGPADRDGDGAVSLDEAYTYAYHHTLVNTASTRVGEQHVTLETRLRGKGEMVLTRPAVADAWLVLDGDLGGRLLVIHQVSGTVVGEVVKEKDSRFSLALPSGTYRVLGRKGEATVSCRVDLPSGRETLLSTGSCELTDQAITTVVKASGPYRVAPLVVEVGFGVLDPARGGPFFDTLESFSFDPYSIEIAGVASLAVSGRLRQRFSWVGTFSTLDAGTYSRSESGPLPDGEIIADDLFRWSSQRLTASVRYTQPLGIDALLLTVQGGGGPTLATTRYRGDSGSVTESLFGPHVAGSVGFHAVVRTRGIDFGPYLSVGGTYAPTLKNLLSERGDVGGVSYTLGLRMSP